MFYGQAKFVFSLFSCLGGMDNIKHSNEIDLFDAIDQDVSLAHSYDIFTFMHLPHACIQTDLRCIARYTFISLCVSWDWTYHFYSANAKLNYRNISGFKWAPGEMYIAVWKCFAYVLLAILRDPNTGAQTGRCCAVYGKQREENPGPG